MPAARTKISLARVRNSFANNKSCSAISHSVRFQGENSDPESLSGGKGGGPGSRGRAACVTTRARLNAELCAGFPTLRQIQSLDRSRVRELLGQPRDRSV